MAISLTNAIKQSQYTALKANADAGFVKVYSGTAPATADTALSGNTLLATITLGATAFATGSNGSGTNNAVGSNETNATAGTASFFRLFKTDGTTVVAQGTVTATGGGGDLTLPSTTITSGATVTLATGALTLTQG